MWSKENAIKIMATPIVWDEDTVGVLDDTWRRIETANHDHQWDSEMVVTSGRGWVNVSAVDAR